MKISNVGIDLLAETEGLRLNSYKDIAGKWTIGIGTTFINGNPVKENMTCTAEQAFEYLETHLEQNVYPVMQNIHVPLNQNQFDALCSLIYNIGDHNFRKSTLLLELNELNYSKAAEQIKVWNKVNGKVSKGLTERRTKEFNLFTKRK